MYQPLLKSGRVFRPPTLTSLITHDAAVDHARQVIGARALRYIQGGLGAYLAEHRVTSVRIGGGALLPGVPSPAQSLYTPK